MVAEDNRVNQRVIQRMLEHLQCVPVLVETGRAAVEALQAGPVDLVLMDCQMPDLDGFEATRAIRKFDQETPVVALSADAYQESRDQGLAAGMNDYVTKPIKLETLASVLCRWTH